VATSFHTLVQALKILAGFAAVASLVITALYVHDRRQRVPGLLLPAAVLLMIVASMFDDSVLALTITGIGTVMAVAAAAITFRALRVPPSGQ
jgi:branched-subunit amino acid transport protein AzlD